MGRRKSLAKREASGKVQREPKLPAPSEVRRLRDAALAGMRDPFWGTQIGRLFLAGKLTAEQYAAGKRWAERATLYRQAIESPGDPRAMDYNRSSGGAPVDPYSKEGLRQAERHRRAAASFVDAHAALCEVGHRVADTVRSVCERDFAPEGQSGLDNLCVGLSRIADFYGLTEPRKSPHVR